MWGMIGCKTPKPQVIRFTEDSRDGIELAKNIRRWASSDFAFRQRSRTCTHSERKSDAEQFRCTNPDLADALLDFRNVKVTAEVSPDNRKSWSPRDPGREKGFSVRNAATAVGQYLKMTALPF